MLYNNDQPVCSRAVCWASYMNREKLFLMQTARPIRTGTSGKDKPINLSVACPINLFYALSSLWLVSRRSATGSLLHLCNDSNTWAKEGSEDHLTSLVGSEELLWDFQIYNVKIATSTTLNLMEILPQRTLINRLLGFMVLHAKAYWIISHAPLRACAVRQWMWIQLHQTTCKESKVSCLAKHAFVLVHESSSVCSRELSGRVQDNVLKGQSAVNNTWDTSFWCQWSCISHFLGRQ